MSFVILPPAVTQAYVDAGDAAALAAANAYTDAQIAAIPKQIIGAQIFNPSDPLSSPTFGIIGLISVAGTGEYDVPFQSSEADTNYVVMLTVDAKSPTIAYYELKTVDGFKVRQCDLSGSPSDVNIIDIAVMRF